eukprot:s1580_g12.t1
MHQVAHLDTAGLFAGAVDTCFDKAKGSWAQIGWSTQLGIKDLPCDLCQSFTVERRLRMEVSVARSAEALQRSLKNSDGQGVSPETAKERLTPGGGIPAGDGRSFLSIYDGTTRYKLGMTIYDRNGGFFVHSSEEHAERSMQSFPRHSAAWAVPRTVLLVRGEGRVRLKHGKVLFDGLTPLMEVPASERRKENKILRSPWRR